jgi:hypothetical protein
MAYSAAGRLKVKSDDGPEQPERADGHDRKRDGDQRFDSGRLMERNMRRPFRSTVLAAVLAASWSHTAPAQSIVPDLEEEIRQRATQIEDKLVSWRRDIHEHPELGEHRTSGK